MKFNSVMNSFPKIPIINSIYIRMKRLCKALTMPAKKELSV
jgi:hypothetical protein